MLMYDKNTNNVIRIVLSVTGPRSSGLSVHVKDNPLCRVITISFRSYFTGRFSVGRFLRILIEIVKIPLPPPAPQTT